MFPEDQIKKGNVPVSRRVDSAEKMTGMLAEKQQGRRQRRKGKKAAKCAIFKKIKIVESQTRRGEKGQRQSKMSVEKERRAGWIRGNSDVDCATGTWDLSVFSCLSKYTEEAYKGDRHRKQRRHGKEDERVQFDLSP